MVLLSAARAHRQHPQCAHHHHHHQNHRQHYPWWSLALLLALAVRGCSSEKEAGWPSEGSLTPQPTAPPQPQPRRQKFEMLQEGTGIVDGYIIYDETSEFLPEVVGRYCDASSLTFAQCFNVLTTVQQRTQLKPEEWQFVPIMVNSHLQWLPIGEQRQHTQDMINARSRLGSFTQSWFLQVVGGFQHTLRFTRDAGVPTAATAGGGGLAPSHGLRILEIGAFEGLSTTWFLLHYGPATTVTCVDPFDGRVTENGGTIAADDAAARHARFAGNVAFAGARVRLRRGVSARALFGLAPGSFDVAYVDGAHTAPEALSDMVMAFHLLRPGGYLLLDDILGGVQLARWPDAEWDARMGVDQAWHAWRAFQHMFGARLRVVARGYQVHAIKIA